MAAQDIEVVLRKNSKCKTIGIIYKKTFDPVGYTYYYDDNRALKHFEYHTQRMSKKFIYKDRYGYEFTNGIFDIYVKLLENNSDGRKYFVKYFERKYPGLHVFSGINYGGFKTDK